MKSDRDYALDAYFHLRTSPEDGATVAEWRRWLNAWPASLADAMPELYGSFRRMLDAKPLVETRVSLGAVVETKAERRERVMGEMLRKEAKAPARRTASWWSLFL